MPRPLLFHCGDLRNLGDLALLLQNLEAAKPGRRRFVRRWTPLPPAIVAQVEAAGGELVDGRRLFAFVMLASRCDLVIGGGQLVRGNVSLRSLAWQWAGAAAARLGGGTVSTRGLGVGAIRDPARLLLWRSLLRLARPVRVRDESSARHAAALVGPGNVEPTADMAFLPGRLHHAARVDAPAPDRVLIAPCVDGSERRSIDGPAFPALVGAIERALPGLELVFACHDPTMDAAVADRLIERYDLRHARKSDGYDLFALLDEYASAALVVTNRLHALIFALLAGRPVLAVDDGAGKTAAMAGRFGVPVVSAADPAGVPAAVEAALRPDRDARERALAETAALARRNLPGQGVPK